MDTFTYDSAPEFVDHYDDVIKAATEKLRGRDPFSYDPEEDPAYQQYKDQYTRQGKLAMEDTLGQVSARTGGLASSYAGSAAQQSYNQYMSALADKVPELRQLAYQMYRDEGDDMRADLNLLLNLDQRDYNRYQDRLGQYNTEKNFAYGAWSDQQDRDYRAEETAYRREQDQYEKDKYEEEKAYQREQDQYNKDLMAGEYMAGAGQFGKLAQALGLSEDETQALVDKYARENAVTQDEAARQVADWFAKYGDYSKAKELGVDTGYLEQEQMGQQSTGYQRSGGPSASPSDETEHSMKDIDPASIAGLGIFNLDFDTIEEMVEEGKLEPYEMENHRLGVRWANGYDANRWWQESGGKIGGGTKYGRGGNR